MAKKTGALTAIAAATAMLIANTADLKSGQPHHQAAILSPPFTAEIEHIVEEPMPYTAPQNIVAAFLAIPAFLLRRRRPQPRLPQAAAPIAPRKSPVARLAWLLSAKPDNAPK